ncbi:MAG TPA: hypothetical protein VK479_13235 [Micropepsaceae bacterium]|nr:hypothetical protein [Micropepsaceae bacterium]
MMSDQLTFEQIWTLRAEAEESRQLAASFDDNPTVIDLEGYASALEAEAAKLQSKQEFSCRDDPAPRNRSQNLHAILWSGRV